MINIKKELESNQVILSIFSSDCYNESIIELMRSLKAKKICYISLNKTANSLIKQFKSKKIKTNKIFFIDAISSTINPNEKHNNSIMVSSPYALTELSIAITQALESKIFDIVVFDSLSTLNIYNYAPKTAGQFTSHIINQIKSKKDKGIFTCIQDDEKTELVKESSMFVDKVVRFDDTNKDNKKKIYTLALLLLGLFFISLMEPNIIGMATLEEIPDINPRFPLILAGIFFLAAVIIYRKPFFSAKESILPPKRPDFKIKANIPKLKKGFKAKINNWVNFTN